MVVLGIDPGYAIVGYGAVETLRAYVRDGARDRTVLSDLKSYFGLSEEEMAHYFGTVASNE